MCALQPDTAEHFEAVEDPRFHAWRRVHRGASFVLGALAIVHVAVTPLRGDGWTADAVWFMGTGLGLLFLAGMNVAHVGLGPCRMPTAPAVRIANWVFAAFGVAATFAVPEPQAVVILLALVLQAIASHRTLIGGGHA
jgi:hypothetical protein